MPPSAGSPRRTSHCPPPRRFEHLAVLAWTGLSRGCALRMEVGESERGPGPGITVGLVGTGRMGSAMAHAIARAGCDQQPEMASSSAHCFNETDGAASRVRRGDGVGTRAAPSVVRSRSHPDAIAGRPLSPGVGARGRSGRAACRAQPRPDNPHAHRRAVQPGGQHAIDDLPSFSILRDPRPAECLEAIRSEPVRNALDRAGLGRQQEHAVERRFVRRRGSLAISVFRTGSLRIASRRSAGPRSRRMEKLGRSSIGVLAARLNSTPIDRGVVGAAVGAGAVRVGRRAPARGGSGRRASASG